MKILYFTPYYPPQSEAAATRSFWFVRTLIKAGHNVELMTASNLRASQASNKERSLLRLLKEHLVGLELFLKIVFKKADFIVLSSPPFFTVCWGALASWLSGKPFILDIRDLYPEVFFEMGLIKQDCLFGRAARAITKTMYTKAHGIMTVTQGLIEEIKSYNIPSDKMKLARNGYDPALFYPGLATEKLPIFSLIFHGTLGKAQNIETLLKLAKYLETNEDIQFIIAGDGPKLDQILSAKRKNIRYHGKLSYREMPNLIRKCHVGLSFRTDDKVGREAFPVKLFEYIGCELPVIISPRCEAGLMIEQDQLGFQFENSEIEAMANQILAWKKNEPKIKAKQIYTRTSQSEKILEFFQR